MSTELRAFVANASHELRTPLTVVKLRAEALREGALEDTEVAERFLGEIETEVDRLVRMVNDLLDLSRMEAGLDTGKRTALNLNGIAHEVYETFKIRAARAEVNLLLDIEPGLPVVMGNEDQFRRVFYNLLENAIKYTPSGGQVEMLLEAGTQPEHRAPAGARFWTRHRARTPAARLRALLPGRDLANAPRDGARQRAGISHRQVDRGKPRRGDGRQQPAWQRHDLLGRSTHRLICLALPRNACHPA